MINRSFQIWNCTIIVLLSQKDVGEDDLQWHKGMALYSTAMMVLMTALSERQLHDYAEAKDAK